jgi:ABC-type uncharacterized transport system involved in gliding motility auxiliary subunit
MKHKTPPRRTIVAGPRPATGTTAAKRGALALLALALAAVLFAAANVWSNVGLRGLRLDLTENRLYTLSDGTLAVLKRIDEPITLRFYFSQRLAREIPAYGNYAQRVRDLLEEYASAAGGKLKLEIYDPTPFSDVEDRAVAYGLQGVPVSAQGDLVYFGLAGTNKADDEEVVPFFQTERERFLELDLTKIVANLAKPKKRAVALISDLPLGGDQMAMMMGQMPQQWMILDQLQQVFDVRQMAGDIGQIDRDVDVVMVVHPKTMSEKTLYAIDQFVMGGGKAIVFVDPNAEADRPPPRSVPTPPVSTATMKKLFDAWGVEIAENKVVGDRLVARKVSAGPATRVRAVDYVAWLTLRRGNFNPNDVVTAEIGLLNMATAGIIKAKEGATTAFTPLVSSSPAASMAIDVEKVRGQPDPLTLLRDFRPSNEVYVMAARVTGTVKSAFPDGPPKAEAKADQGAQPATAAEPQGPHLAEAKEPLNAIIVADTDLLDDRFWVQVREFFGQRAAEPIANNADFVVNAIESLMGAPELISLRSRGISARPFELVQSIQRTAEDSFRTKERELQDKLKETEKKLKDLQTKEQGQGQVILTQEQQLAIENFRAEMLATRKELRDVQHALREDIESLQSLLQFANIGLIPVLVTLVAIAIGLWRMNRRSRPAVIG